MLPWFRLYTTQKTRRHKITTPQPHNPTNNTTTINASPDPSNTTNYVNNRQVPLCVPLFDFLNLVETKGTQERVAEGSVTHTAQQNMRISQSHNSTENRTKVVPPYPKQRQTNKQTTHNTIHNTIHTSTYRRNSTNKTHTEGSTTE